MDDAGDTAVARRSEPGPWHLVAALWLLSLELVGCGPQTPPPRLPVDGTWSSYLATVVRGRSSVDVAAGRCDDSGFSSAVEDVFWARGHASPPQREEIDAWLGSVAFGFFQHCYDTARGAIAAMPSYATWRRAEADYSAWLSAHSQRMLRKIYTGAECGSDACVPFARRWPGFDALAAGLPVVNRWERSGHATDPEVDVVVCPRPLRALLDRRREDDDALWDHIDRPGLGRADMRCGWFRHAMTDAETTRRLAGILGSYDDPALVRAVVSNSGSMSPERVVALWHALEPWPRMWREAGVTAADALMDEHAMETPLIDEAIREYATPEHSDVALYVLARDWTWTNARMGFGAHPWEKFADDHGGPIGMPLFARLLDVSPRSVDLVPIVWPALAKGDSRVLPVLDRLDAYLDDAGASMQTLQKMAGTVCQRGSKRELAQLHEWLVRRAQPGSKHHYDVDSAASSTKPGHCTAPL
jgi:hypothetical protein